MEVASKEVSQQIPALSTVVNTAACVFDNIVVEVDDWGSVSRAWDVATGVGTDVSSAEFPRLRHLPLDDRSEAQRLSEELLAPRVGCTIVTTARSPQTKARHPFQQLLAKYFELITSV